MLILAMEQHAMGLRAAMEPLAVDSPAEAPVVDSLVLLHARYLLQTLPVVDSPAEVPVVDSLVLLHARYLLQTIHAVGTPAAIVQLLLQTIHAADTPAAIVQLLLPIIPVVFVDSIDPDYPAPMR